MKRKFLFHRSIKLNLYAFGVVRTVAAASLGDDGILEIGSLTEFTGHPN